MNADRQRNAPIARIGLANGLTTVGLGLSLVAMLLWIQGARDVALIAWFLAVGVDQVDGSVARWTGSESRFGALLDAHADALTYGIAPAMFVVVGHAQGWVAGPALLLVFAVVWRCAHQSAEAIKDITVGIPACVLVFVLSFSPGPVAPWVCAGIVGVGAAVVLGPAHVERRSPLGVALIVASVGAFGALLWRVA